jgi:hypothetical protein
MWISNYCSISEKKRSVITSLLIKGLQDCPVCPVKNGFEDRAVWSIGGIILTEKPTYSEENLY